MKKNKTMPENYLEKIPLRAEIICWSKDEYELVTLEVENRGVFNRIAQKLFKKPKVSYIHLDENGSFVWQQLDGEKNLVAIGEAIKEHFGGNAEPLYPRLSQFIKILESYNFISFKVKKSRL